MAIRKKTSTTRLPQSLLQQLDESSDHPQKFHRTRSRSRKEARKEDRASQRQKKAAYFSYSRNARKRPAEEEHQESPQHKKPRQNAAPVNRPSTPPTTASSSKKSMEQKSVASSATQVSNSKPRSVEKKLKTHTVSYLKGRKEEEEDNYIAYLESKLGLVKTGKRKKVAGVEEDGLDDLLDWADSVEISSKNVQPEPEDTNDSDEGEDDSDGESSGNYDDGEEWKGISRDSPALEETSSREDSNPGETVIAKPAPTSLYVPPHLGKLQRQDDANSETILKLTRQLKGLLNRQEFLSMRFWQHPNTVLARMSEQNIGTIITSIEEVYREHRRNDVTSTLTTLIINGISSHSMLLDSYVVLYATFVASLHKIIGVEFAAYVVQSTVAAYEKHFHDMQDANFLTEDTAAEKDGKECSNLLVLIAELYNFQVISSALVFDIIRVLLDAELTEFKVELLLKIVRSSGQQLRQDDPSALKDIIQIVQGKVSPKDDGISSRTRFMVETLTNLKNNKLKRNATQNQGGAAVERMKKFLTGLSKTRHVLAHDPLRVSLEDLHSSETKGKWWLVGAAWGGDPLVDKQAEFAKAKDVAQEADAVPDDSANLLKLARAQGMNTEIRRGMFIVLMSSADYTDACERLAQLNLTEVQQREIIRVLLHCCENERSYNPYYALVCQQLCRTSHAYKITLQYCLWDFLRDLGESNVGGAAIVKNLEEGDGFDLKEIPEVRLRNIARAYGWWIAKDSVSLAILKPLDFTVLKSTTRSFLRELFMQILVNSQRSAPIISDVRKVAIFTRNRNAVEEVFIKASRVRGLAMGLVYFLSNTFQDKPDTDDEFSKFLQWAVGVATETLRTGVAIAPTL
ncbi:hypothetical protein NLJ89_g1761 [Agrocybe chaxingu]|uniref:MI domain-containing protein n=1 Tax=Agrocybe chaxingu TaxID=84603 RepID=A0A9W8TEL8_9AGAR|nr:hypothetical protein NLJ89_g1761 [Agrocybe chaxingu]